MAGVIDFSVLFAGVTVQQGAIVRDSIVMPGAVIEEGAVVEYAIIGENAVIGKGARVGVRPENIIDKDQWGIAVIAEGVHVGAGAVVAAKAMVDQDIAGEEC